MRALAELPIPQTLRGRARAIAFLAVASACAAYGTTPPAPSPLREASGFTITESGRVGGGARADFDRATRLLEEEQYQQGIALLVQVTEAAPDATAAHINLGIAYRRMGDLERAEASIRRALELNPRHPVALNELGIICRTTGRFDEARRSYEAALAVHPGFHFARRNLAILCDVYLADLDCALQHYEAYAETVPDDPQVEVWLADVRQRLGR